MPFNDWDEVALAAESIFSTSAEVFDTNTIENARDLLTICRSYSSVPTVVAKGYWSTLCLVWNNFELEVFEDRIEVYHLGGPPLQIWYQQHAPGQEFPLRFLAELPTVSGETGIA